MDTDIARAPWDTTQGGIYIPPPCHVTTELGWNVTEMSPECHRNVTDLCNTMSSRGIGR